MRHDENLKLQGNKVILVPYRKEHVVKYHEWMANEEILRLTGSERLTLDEEFAMQISWTNDADKCTFIILDSLKHQKLGNEELSMVGDTNLYLNDHEDRTTAEIEIMIAEEASRRQGFATEALNMMIDFGRNKLGILTFIAKIKLDNTSSIKLFESLGFIKISKSEVFQEITLSLVWPPTNSKLQNL